MFKLSTENPMPETITRLTTIWEDALKEIEKRVEPRIFDTIFRGTHVVKMEDKTLIIAVSTPFAATLIKNKFGDIVQDTLLKVSETDFQADFVVQSEMASQPEAKKEDKVPEFFANSHLDRQFTFDKFVVGPCNLEAYQASLMISSTPGQLYNPLVLYSGPGLGKTHLLQAIGNSFKEKNPNAKVLFTSASDFTDEYVKFATGYKEDRSLVDYFRNDVDIFLIDDIQYLKNKAKTMEMFFIIFQALVDAGKQIVITSDQPPASLEGIDERLRSRFSKGLVLNIEPPDLETSKAILRKKIEAQNLNPEDFDEEVITFLASKFSKNVRELEGTLLRLIFYTVSVRPVKHITIGYANEAIRPLVEAQEGKDALTENKVITTVANYYSLTPSQLTGKIRTSRVALARHIAMYLDRELLGTPLIKIGQAFGGRDHSTVLNGIAKVEKSLKDDIDMEYAINELKSKLKK